MVSSDDEDLVLCVLSPPLASGNVDADRLAPPASLSCARHPLTLTFSALALSAREAATGGSSSRQGLFHPPPVRGDDLIELGDSSDEDGSDDEIQILDDAPSPTRASASSARHDPTSRRENALASSSCAAAAAANGIGRPLSSSSGRAGMRSGLVDANAVRRDDLRLRDAAELARLRFEAEQASGTAAARSAGGSSIAQSGVRLGGRPGPPLRPQQLAESFEEGGMDAEMML